MSEIPFKVVAILASEIGITLGMGVLLFYSFRATAHATINGRWNQLRDL